MPAIVPVAVESDLPATARALTQPTPVEDDGEVTHGSEAHFGVAPPHGRLATAEYGAALASKAQPSASQSSPSDAPHSGHGTLSASLRTKARAPPLERSPALLKCIHRRGACLSSPPLRELKWVHLAIVSLALRVLG